MDKKWAALVPQRQLVGKSGKPLLSLTRASGIRLIGRLPEDAYVRIFIHLGISDIVNLATCCRKLAALSNDERVWIVKLALLQWSGEDPIEAKKILGKQDEQKRQSAAFIGSPVLNSSSSGSGHARRQSSVSDVPTPSNKKRDSVASSARASGSGSGLACDNDTTLTTSTTSSTPRASVSSASASTSASTPASSHLERKKSNATEEDEDDIFGDFVDFNSSGNNDETNVQQRRNSTKDLFFSSSPANHGPDGAFSSISLDAQPIQPTKIPSSSKQSGATPRAIRKSEDLLMLFDDETDDMGLASVSPPQPTLSTKTSASTAGNTSYTLDRRKSLKDHQTTGSIASNTFPSSSQHSSPALSRDLFRAYFQFLIPYYVSLQYQNTSSLVFTQPALTDISRAHILSNLKRLLQPSIAPTQYSKRLLTVHRNLQSSIDYFEASMLASFEKATDRRVQREMREAAHAAYALNGGVSVIQIFINKIPLFNDQSWDPLSNLTKTMDMSGQLVDGIDFSAMDEFMDHVQGVVTKEGTLIARVFPPDSDALVYFTDRLANDVLSDYILDLLNAARDLPKPLFLLTTAATFGQCQRLIETVLAIEPRSTRVTDESISRNVYRMFEPHVPAYLKQEGEWCRAYLEEICVEWERKLAEERANRDPTFLSTANPQQAKRNILAGFTKALLLPVTIVPKTVAFSVNAITQGGTMAFNAMSGGLGASSAANGASTPKAITPSVKEFDTPTTPLANGDKIPLNLHGESFQSLISIETAMQLIQADRECLKRVQTFVGYSGTVGLRVKRVIEEIFIILCQTVSSSHLTPAFAKATDQMGSYKPADHAVDESVAPLVQFFELVHIGDTILQMVQVYYDREMIKYVDKNDFLSNIVREKKKFENALDESVASGLNAGVNILMTQAEYILSTQQDPTDFCPELRNSQLEKGQISIITAKNAVVDIEGPSKAAEAVVDCLRSHCQMLRGSTDKAILEVFHQEVGLRLHGILLKHLKKSIVSVSGGFQVIADLNLYTSFISSLKLPSVNPYFSALKMAANIFIIDSPRDLGVMARDLDRYEGTLRIEDIMEMVQCRTDWKKIEREVEKEVFGFKTEDCVVS